MKAKLTIACVQCPSKKSVCTISSNTFSLAGSSLYPLVNVTYNIAETSKVLKQSTDITHLAVNACHAGTITQTIHSSYKKSCKF